jgi:hypothetical protein
MFRPELRQSSHDVLECDEAVEHAANATFQVLLDGLAAAQQAGLLRAEPSVEMLALTLWSTIHGLTVLLLDQLLVEKLDQLLVDQKARSAIEKTEQLMTQVMQVVAQGLVVRDPFDTRTGVSR